METIKVLWDYRTEGHQFDDREFESVNDAVQYAVNQGYSAPFKIVKVVSWGAIPLSEREGKF